MPFKNWKVEKVNYFLFFIFLTLLPVTIFQSFLEAWSIKEILADGLVPEAYNFLGVNCYLSPFVKITLLLAGIICGYIIGRVKWQSAIQQAALDKNKTK